ncbi:MAG: M23 family metallopeptidase [Anaerolineae bacterium]|nr:M23 family metallopeptidase [Anaerolineae bacterium]
MVFAGWHNGGFGNLVVIDHGNGFQTYYGHLSRISVRCTAGVSAGQQVGAVGSTGNSTGPHLHFEIQQNGMPVSPHFHIIL